MEFASWLRHRLRAITRVDFPAGGQSGDAQRRETTEGCSYGSRVYGRRLMLRSNEKTYERLENLSRHFKKSRAEIVRDLVAQATLETFPTRWSLEVEEHRLEGEA
jgi:predicted DNA-binding protein